MISRALLVLLAIAAASHALSPATATFRGALGSLRAPWVSFDKKASAPSIQLLQNTDTSTSGTDQPDERDPSDPSDPDFDWDSECDSILEIFNFMNTTGCLDENGSLPGASNVTGFCSMCDIQRLYDMGSDVEVSCYGRNSQLAEGISWIIPFFGAVCTQDANGDYCAAPVFLDDDCHDDDSCANNGTATESEADDRDPFAMLCDSSCPWWDEMVALTYNCFPQLLLYGSICVQDYDRHCVESLNNVVYSNNGGVPDVYAVDQFCDDPCGGALIEFWEHQPLPECRSESGFIDPSSLCIRREDDGLYCTSEVIPTIDETLETCNFTGANVDWTCEGDCSASVEYVVEALGCCGEEFFLGMFGSDIIEDIDLWLTDTCGMSTPTSGCKNDYIQPSDREECVEVRDNGLTLNDAIKCLMEYHTSTTVVV